MSTNFYDKVANKFGKYHTKAKYTIEYPAGEPEKVFKKKLLELGGEQKVVLDAGCADGRFTLSMSLSFKKIVAIDMSEGMLKAAQKLQNKKNIKNIVFEKQDAFRTSYKDKSFDLVYSRRGPTIFMEAFRLLKPGGYFIEIDIGEQDCMEIKKIFGRGQNFGEWDTQRKEIVMQKAGSAGFETVFLKNFFYNEYYSSYEDLNLFLQGVPIFEDYSTEKDKVHLQKYVDKYITEKGIKLERHRVVMVLQKP